MRKIYKSQLDSIEEMSQDIEVFLEEAGAEDIIFVLNLCLDELFTNIITYGYKNEPNNKIELSVELEGSEVVTIIKDSSPAFDPITDAPEADTSSSIEDREIGGLGIFLCKKNMDSFSYEFKDGKNVLKLVKKFK